MRIAGTEYNLNQKALEIYVSGCDGACDGCHNKELWDFNVGKSYYENMLQTKIFNPMIERVWIMGGEPLLQNEEDLYDLLLDLSYRSDIEIWVWTRFYEDNIPDDIKYCCDYIKVGEYLKDSESYIEPLFGIELASKNQKIIKIRK